MTQRQQAADVAVAPWVLLCCFFLLQKQKKCQKSIQKNITKIQIGHLTCWSLLTFGLHADVRADVKFVRVDVDLCMLTCVLT